MAKYTPTEWKDEIRDANGNLVQQGTPLSAANLKKMETGIAEAVKQTEVVTAQLADIANVVNVKDFGATPNSLIDQTPFIQAAVDHLIVLGGGTLLIPSGEYRIIADANTNTTPYKPKRVEIRGKVNGSVGPPDTRVVKFVENIHIKGDKETVIYMTGMSEETLRGIDDIQMSNVDVFSAFSFAYAKKCSVSNIKFKGDYAKEGIPFRYSTGVSQARAKAIAFFGSHECEVYNCEFQGILGNFVHVNTASSSLDGYWMPSSNVIIRDNVGVLCLEIGINLTTITRGCRVLNNSISKANGAGIEGPAIISNNNVFDCHGGGISPSWDALVTNNNIDNVRDGIIVAITADISNNQHINAVISNNLIKNTKKTALTAYAGSGNFTFSNNRIINTNMEKDTTFNVAINLSATTEKPIKNVNLLNNYFEVNSVESFIGYGVYIQNMEDSVIKGNEFNVVNTKVLTNDIYLTGTKGLNVTDNKLSKGIGQSSVNKNRNLYANNIFPNAKIPFETDWAQLTPPDTGDWRVGDFLKKNPVITNNIDGSINIELGWYCTSISPLSWTTHRITTRAIKETKGSATIPTGESAIIVAHGLIGTPTNIMVTPRGNIGNWWVSDTNTTTFTISCNSPVALPQIVWWSVRI